MSKTVEILILLSLTIPFTNSFAQEDPPVITVGHISATVIDSISLSVSGVPKTVTLTEGDFSRGYLDLVIPNIRTFSTAGVKIALILQIIGDEENAIVGVEDSSAPSGVWRFYFKNISPETRTASISVIAYSE